MATQSPTDNILPQWKKQQAKQGCEMGKCEGERKLSTAKISESAKPILEEQALLKEKLKTLPSWKKDKDARRKAQPMVARPPSPSGFIGKQSIAQQGTSAASSKPPSPPPRRRTASPSNSFNAGVSRSSSPLFEVPPEIKRKVEKATRARLYLLQQLGPNSFMIGGDSPSHKFKVIIGPQTCTCGKTFCIHLLFVMLRVFKVKENDPKLWSNNLKNFEVEGLFMKFRDRLNSRLAKNSRTSKTGRGKSPQRVTPPPSSSETSSSASSSASASSKDEEEVCPICLLEMVEGESLMCCTDGCNNTLHQHCMEIWAAECRLRKERLNCPLCRRNLPPQVVADLNCRSPTGPMFSPSSTPNVPVPLEPGEVITLPHSDPIPSGQVELARPWVQAFGEDLISCLFSREWNIREVALRRLSKDLSASLTVSEESNSTNMTAVEACCSMLSMMCGDPVYRVYVAALRTLRVMLAHTRYHTSEEKLALQMHLQPVIEAVMAKCCDGNRRISALSMKVLLEICKDEAGDLALGRMLENQENQPLGGLGFMLACILTTAHEYATWPWWLGRLNFLRKLLDEYVESFQLGCDHPEIAEDSVGVILQDHHEVDGAEIFSDNATRLMSVMKFAILAAQCSHSKVTKLAVSVLTSCTSLAASCPSAFIHIKKLVSKLKPSQRSILQRRLFTIARRHSYESSDNDSILSEASTMPMDDAQGPSRDVPDVQRTMAGGGCSTSHAEDETDNLTESELLQSIVESLQRPHDLALPRSLMCSPTRDLESLEWSRVEGESPRFPPVKVVMGGKCQKMIEEEEAEALARAMELSTLERGPQKIPSLQPHAGDPDEDEMVIVYTQPESLENAANTKHLYLENVHWKKGELLGTGAFSSCYAARDVFTGSLMAVKQVSFCRNSKSEQEKVCQTIMDEIEIIARLKHPHLIKCLGATRHTGHFNIFLEWMAGGSISLLLSKYGQFEEAILIRYLRQILQGVAYLHENQVVHRDIKGANILVDSTGQDIRLADFGASARLATQITVAGEFQGQLLGTIAFMAPEVLRGESYGRSCDVWSVGCVLIEMATGRPPWNAHEHSNHLALIFKIACASAPPEIPEHLNPAIRDVVLRCLESKPEERPPALELLKHPLFTKM